MNSKEHFQSRVCFRKNLHLCTKETQMINPKERLREYLNQLIQRFLNIKSLFQELNRIYSWYVPGRVETINLSSYFFQLSTYSMTRIYLVELAIMLSEKENRSLLNWLKKAQEYAELIGPTRYNPNHTTGDREPIEIEEYKAIIDSHIRKLEYHKSLIGRIKAWRDKSITHLDKAYFDNPSAIVRDYPINNDEIVQLIEVVSKILKQHYSYLFQADLRMEILSEMNVDIILNYARAFQRVRKDNALIDRGFRPVEYMKEDY